MVEFTGHLEREKIASHLKDHAGMVIVCVLFALAGVFSLNRVLVYTPDSARYLAWAKSLADLEGFRDITTPMPVKYVVHAPMYSVLLAPIAAFFPYSVPAAKVAQLFFGMAVLVAFYLWMRRMFGKAWSVAAVAVLAFNPVLVIYSTQVLSDVPFTLAVILFLHFLEKALEGNASPVKQSLVVATVVVCAMFLREVGVTLVVVGTLAFFFAKRPRQAMMLLVVSVLFYALWYARNEVLVASVEHPPMRNSQVFLKHMFTATDASLVGEFLARATSNSAVYSVALTRLPLMAEMVVRNISACSPAQFPYSVVANLMPLAYTPVLLFTLLTTVLGAVVGYRQRRRFLLLVLFLGCYCIPILLYPINDVRFLLPVLIVVLHFLVAGTQWIYHLILSRGFSANIAKGAGMIGLCLMSVPNLGWTITYVSNSYRYGRAPLEFFRNTRSLPFSPELFSRPLDLAGAWIAQHADSSDVVVCRWKELALWTDGRLVIDADPQTTLDEFDALLRDYRVRYVVTVCSRGGLREYESQFARSTRFTFVPVQRIADIEVDRVSARNEEESAPSFATDSVEFGDRYRFDRALSLIQEGRPAEAETVMTNLPGYFKTQVPVQLNIAIAKEFAGRLDAANAILERFRYLQQAGSAVQQAWYHQELIARIRNADRAPAGPAKAELFHRVALDFWQLGYRLQTLRYLDSAVVEDRTYFPAIIFRTICSVQVGDSVSARATLNQARRLDPANLLVQSLERILTERSRLIRTRSPEERVAIRTAIAEQWEIIGLRESAIDELLEILREDPRNIRGLRMLTRLYEDKGRYAPAVFYLQQLLALLPSEALLQEHMKELKRRW